MAIVIKKHSHLCARCNQPIAHHADQIKVLRIGVYLRMHWGCFLNAMRESDQCGAEVVAEAVR